MEIILITTLCGPHGNAWPGDKLDIPDVAAAAMIHGGYAYAAHAKVERVVPAIKQPMPETRKQQGKR